MSKGRNTSRRLFVRQCLQTLHKTPRGEMFLWVLGPLPLPIIIAKSLKNQFNFAHVSCVLILRKAAQYGYATASFSVQLFRK